MAPCAFPTYPEAVWTLGNRRSRRDAQAGASSSVRAPGEQHLRFRPVRSGRWRKQVIQSISLCRAVLCQSCTQITESHHDHCNACGASGEGLILLSRVLNRVARAPHAECLGLSASLLYGPEDAEALATSLRFHTTQQNRTFVNPDLQPATST